MGINVCISGEPEGHALPYALSGLVRQALLPEEKRSRGVEATRGPEYR